MSAQTLYLMDPWWNPAVEEQVLLLQSIFFLYYILCCLFCILYTAVSGLNLVSAQTLYLLDPWWNPTVEEQARCMNIAYCLYRSIKSRNLYCIYCIVLYCVVWPQPWVHLLHLHLLHGAFA